MKMLFISGAQRSGTTMVEQVVNTHPEFYITHELNWIHVLKCINGALYHPKHTSRKVLQFNGDYTSLMESLYKGSTTKSINVFGDKLPDYTHFYDIIHKFFPDAKHVFCLRNPFDVINSMFSRVYDGKIGLDRGWDADLGLERMCQRVNEAYENFTKFRDCYPDRVHMIKYEEITHNPIVILQRFSEFMGCSNKFETVSIRPRKISREYLTEEITNSIKSRLNKGLINYE